MRKVRFFYVCVDIVIGNRHINCRIPRWDQQVYIVGLRYTFNVEL